MFAIQRLLLAIISHKTKSSAVVLIVLFNCDTIICRSKAPTARLKLIGITALVHNNSEEEKYIILKKKTKTKLVLNADSSVEFDGWLRTIDKISKKVTEQTTDNTRKNYRYENIEDDHDSEKVEPEVNLVSPLKGKTPIPTPRNSTPCKEITIMPGEENSTAEDPKNDYHLTSLKNEVHFFSY